MDPRTAQKIGYSRFAGGNINFLHFGPECIWRRVLESANLMTQLRPMRGWTLERCQPERQRRVGSVSEPLRTGFRAVPDTPCGRGNTPEPKKAMNMNRKNNKWISRAGCALVTCGLMFTSVAEAGLYFWDNGSGVNSDYATPANWNPDGVPGNGDLAVANNSGLPAIQITSNVSADSLRLSDGGAVNHTAGTLTIANGVGPDNGLWVGEFGPAPVSYTLSGGVIHINDPGDGFMVGRGGGSQATFTFNSGSVTNTVGDTHIGLDGVAYWYQSAGNFAGAGVQISRFASPYVLVQLSGTARWDVGLVLLADGHGVFNPRNAGLVDFQLIGPNVVFNCNGLVMQDEGQLTFDGTGGGISTMHLGGGQLLLNNGKLFLNNLPTPGATGQTIVLMDNIGSYTGVDNQFDNAPNGTIYDAGSIDWQIQYQVTNIVLVSVPDCVAPSISVQPQDKQVVLGGSVTFAWEQAERACSTSGSRTV